MWQDVHLPFEEFVPLFRAKKVKDASLNPSTVTSIQVGFSLLASPHDVLLCGSDTPLRIEKWPFSMLPGKPVICQSSMLGETSRCVAVCAIIAVQW